MSTAIERRRRSEYIRDREELKAGQRHSGQPLPSAEPMWVVVRVADLLAKRILVQRLEYRTSPPVEGDVRAVGPFFEIYPPPAAVYGSFGWAVFPLTDIDDNEYDHSPPLWSAEESPEDAAYRAAYDAALAYEEEIVDPATGKTRLGVSPYPIEVVVSGGVLTAVIPLWLHANPDFMEDDEVNEQASEGMGI